MIERVERFEPQLYAYPFAKMEVLEERHVPQLESRPQQRTRALVAERARGRGEGGSVEEFSRGFRPVEGRRPGSPEFESSLHALS